MSDSLIPEYSTQIPPADRRTMSLLLLILAAGVYQIILAPSEGLFHYILLLIAIPVVILALASTVIRSDYARIVRPVIVLACLLGLGQYITFGFSHNFGYYIPRSRQDWIAPLAGYGAIGLLGLTAILWRRRSDLLFVLAVIVHVTLGWWLIAHYSRTIIDVWTFHQESAAAILSGQNPYAIDFVNVYGQGAKVYSPEVQSHGRVLFGFPYPPLSLAMYLPSYWLTGESRYAHALAYAFCGLGIGFMSPGKIGRAAGVLFLTAPACWVVIANSWTEPFILLMLVCLAGVSLRFPKWIPIALGLFLAMKQYNVIFVPLAFLLLPRPFSWKLSIRFIAITLVTMAVVSLPLALWDWAAFWNSTVTIQVKQPFRYDAFSFLALLANAKEKDFVPPGWWSSIAFVLMIPTWIVLLWKMPRNISGFVLAVGLTTIVFLFSNRQAFLNYHTFAAGTLFLAIALIEAESLKKSQSD